MDELWRCWHAGRCFDLTTAWSVLLEIQILTFKRTQAATYEGTPPVNSWQCKCIVRSFMAALANSSRALLQTLLVCVRCGFLAPSLPFSLAHLGYNSLVRDVFLNRRLRPVTGTFIPVICLRLSQIVYSLISSNPEEMPFQGCPTKCHIGGPF